MSDLTVAADAVRAALLEAGRPDLAELVDVRDHRVGFCFIDPPSESDCRLLYKASTLVGLEGDVCADCWVAGDYRDDGRVLHCEHGIEP